MEAFTRASIESGRPPHSLRLWFLGTLVHRPAPQELCAIDPVGCNREQSSIGARNDGDSSQHQQRYR